MTAILKKGTLALFVLAASAGFAVADQPSPSPSSSQLGELQSEYSKLYAPCEECSVGKPRRVLSADCRAKCDKAKKVRKQIESMGGKVPSEATQK